MSFIAFDGHGYNSFLAESTNLVQWTHPRLAMAHDLYGKGTPEAQAWVAPLLQQVRDDQTVAVIGNLDGAVGFAQGGEASVLFEFLAEPMCIRAVKALPEC